MFPQLLQMLFDIINIEKYYHSGSDVVHKLPYIEIMNDCFD